VRLTDLLIKKIASPEQGQKTYFDQSLPGFGVRVSQGGTKSFVVMFGARRQLKTLGRYPDVSLSVARKEAKRVLADSSRYELMRHPTISFSDAKERFLSDAAARTRKRTIDEYQRLLTRHFKLEKSLRSVSRQDVMQVVERLRDTPSEAKHAYVAIRTMMNWCVKQGLLDQSPVPSMVLKTEARSRVLSDNELTQVWMRAKEIGYPYGTIIQLLILTGQRRGEIAALRWDWIDEESITFPASITKNGREHRIPLAPVAKSLLASLPRSGELVFPSRFGDQSPFNGWSKAKRNFDQSLQIAPYTLHDLRRTFSSNLARSGVPIHVTEKLLNHVSGSISGVAAIYNRHSYWNEMSSALFKLQQIFV
jgi:integrase